MKKKQKRFILNKGYLVVVPGESIVIKDEIGIQLNFPENVESRIRGRKVRLVAEIMRGR